jgi:hypothetical protein
MRIDLLEYFNSNTYLSICSRLLNELKEIRGFISEIKSRENKEGIYLLEGKIDRIFSDSELSRFISTEIEKVINPYYLRKVHQVSKGNSSVFINFQIIDPQMVELDVLYKNILKSMLRLFKKLFSVVNVPIVSLNEKSLGKYEVLIEVVEEQLAQWGVAKNDMLIIHQREKLKQENIENLPHAGFYHMTHINNLKGILENGLLSSYYLKNNSVDVFDIANPEIMLKRDRSIDSSGRSILDYVPLYINPINPFMSSKKVQDQIDSIVILEVIPHILVQEKGSLFSDGNAANIETNFYRNQMEMENVNWSLLNEGKWIIKGEGHSEMCSEILVGERIEVKYLNKIIIRSDHSMLTSVMKLFPNHKGVEIEIDDSFFNVKAN